LLLLLSLLIGSSQHIGLIELCQRIGLELGLYKGNDATVLMGSMDTILWQVRLPRTLLTFMVGAALASSGGTLQAIFRNPIVDPVTLGSSSGAPVCADLAMLFPLLAGNVSAFLFRVCAVPLTYFVDNAGLKTSSIGMGLAGMVISGVFTAMLTLLHY